jgi:DNA-binding response OmpR family regulator
LSDKETNLLELLQSRKGAAVGREEIASHVWPELDPNECARTQVIDKSVLRLRAFLHDDPRRPKRLITAGDFGYILL